MKFFLTCALVACWASLCLFGQSDCGTKTDPAYIKLYQSVNSPRNLQINYLKEFELQKLNGFESIQRNLNGGFKLQPIQPIQPRINGTFNRQLLSGAFLQQQLMEMATPPRIIPIVAHIIRKSDRTGGLSTGDLNRAMLTLNANFRRLNMRFVVCEINTVSEDRLADKTYSSRSTNEISGLSVTDRNRRSKLNIYFVPKSNTSWTWNPGRDARRQHILMNNNHAKNTSTLTHEVGHWFGLIHTHGPDNEVMTDELNNGSNCSRSGDFCCDTPADPQLSSSRVSDCRYVGGNNIVDNSGRPFTNPPVDNFLSYAPKACRKRFTNDQCYRMHAAYLNINEERGYRFDPCSSNGNFMFVNDKTSIINFYTVNRNGSSNNRVESLRFNSFPKSWAIPLKTTPFFNHVLVYNKERGTGTFYRQNLNGTLGEVVSQRTGWRKTWDIILQHGQTLIFYDRETGTGQIYALEENGTMGRLIKTHKNWRKSWNIIESTGNTLFFYDRAKGQAEYCKFSNDGNFQIIDRRNGRKTWDIIKIYRTNRERYMLYYDRAAGQIELYEITPQGVTGRLVEKRRARKSWNVISPYVATNYGQLLFYDGSKGEAEFYDLTANGGLGRMTSQRRGWSKSWKQLFYLPRPTRTIRG